MEMSSTTHVGLDTSKKSIQVAMLLPGRREPVQWELANESGAVRRLAKRLLREAFWSASAELPAGHDFVLVARPDAAELADGGEQAVEEALRELLAAAGMLTAGGQS